VKHATLDPVRSMVNRLAPNEDLTEEIKRSDAARGVQHKVEDVKDKADTKFYDTTSKAERGYSHLQKDVGAEGRVLPRAQASLPWAGYPGRYASLCLHKPWACCPGHVILYKPREFVVLCTGTCTKGW